MYLVIDVGGTKIRSAVWDGHQLHDIQSMATPKVSAAVFVDGIVDHLSSRNLAGLQGLGVSTAGPVDVVNGCIRNPANLGNGDSSWAYFEMAKDLKDKLHCPVVLDNDAAMTVFGQYYSIEKEKTKDIVMVTVGTGVGVGAMVGGRLVRAGQNMHPELGHFVMSDQPEVDLSTPFANFPTLESYLSGFHFSVRVAKALGRSLDGNEVTALSAAGNPQVLAMWQDYGRRMAVALTNLYLAYFPQKIVLSGGFVKDARPYFYDTMEQWLSKLLQQRTAAGMPLPVIEIAEAYAQLPLLGAGYNIQLGMSPQSKVGQ